MGVSNFTDLFMWQDARTWSKKIFQLTRAEPFALDRRLVSQINDSSASVAANIAEGFGRGTQGEFVQFLGYAIGSLNETQSHLSIAYDRGYLTRDEFAELFPAGTVVRKKVVKFVQSMTLPGSGVKNLHKKPLWRTTWWETYEKISGNDRPVHVKRMELGLPATPSAGEKLTPEQVEYLKPKSEKQSPGGA